MVQSLRSSSAARPLLALLLFASSFLLVPVTPLTSSKLPNWYAKASAEQPELLAQLRSVPATATTAATSNNRRMAQCMITRDDILGPYFLPGAPNRTQNFCHPANNSKAGSWSMLTVTINLFDGCSGAAIENRTGNVQVWQANNVGIYDNAVRRQGQCSTCDCRASVPIVSKTNRTSKKMAKYSTITPAPYGSPGCLRPAHVHHIFNVTGYQQLTTQMYFRGGKYLGRDDCGCGSSCHSGDSGLQVIVTKGKATWNVFLLPLVSQR